MANTTTYIDKIQVPSGTDTITANLIDTTSGYTKNTGTVTSVQVSATSPVVSSTNTAQSSTLSTTISLADAYGDTKNPYGSKTAGTVLAAPSSEDGTPSFRALEGDEIEFDATKYQSMYSADTIDELISEIENDLYYITSNYSKGVKVITKSGISSLPTTINSTGTSANWYVVNSVLSNPAAQAGDWTVTTGAGTITISGSISGTTDITLYLIKGAL